MATRIELTNPNNPEDAKIISKMMYEITKIDGKIGKDPRINYLYFKYYGTSEEFKRAEEELHEFYDLQGQIASELEIKLAENPNTNKLKKSFSFLGVWHYIQIERGNAA